jgi:WD40 repeat protein
LSKNNIKTNIINENEDGEITDFLLLPNNTIVYPDQEQETFLFYSLIEEPKNKDEKEDENMLPYQEIDKFFLSSAYGEEYIGSMKKVLLYSFDGEIFLYDYKTKQTKNNIQIKKYLENSETNSISNPPYLNKVILNKDNNEIICGMMNGSIIGLKSSLQKTKMKNIHNGSINDIKMSKFKIHNYKEIISYGRDKCLKFIDPQDNFNIDYYADMTCNIIDFDSDIHGNIFYIDDSTKMLYMMKFK